jgi:hypothetical protein
MFSSKYFQVPYPTIVSFDLFLPDLRIKLGSWCPYGAAKDTCGLLSWSFPLFYSHAVPHSALHFLLGNAITLWISTYLALLWNSVQWSVSSVMSLGVSVSYLSLFPHSFNTLVLSSHPYWLSFVSLAKALILQRLQLHNEVGSLHIWERLWTPWPQYPELCQYLPLPPMWRERTLARAHHMRHAYYLQQITRDNKSIGFVARWFCKAQKTCQKCSLICRCLGCYTDKGYSMEDWSTVFYTQRKHQTLQVILN